MKERKYSENFNRDYEFYLANIKKFDVIGVDVSGLKPHKGKYSTKEAFLIWDSQGKIVPCEDPELFLELIKFKKGINFWIKQWAEGFKDMMMPIDYYLEDFKGEVPDWVYASFENQISKIHNRPSRETLHQSFKEIGVHDELKTLIQKIEIKTEEHKKSTFFGKIKQFFRKVKNGEFK